MKVEKVYLVGVHRYCFRAGERCEVVALENVQPDEEHDWRLAYKVKYDDGKTDWVALSDIEAGNWEFVSQLNADLGMLPEISR
jgi:hypothetical protein